MSEFDDQMADLRERFLCRAVDDQETLAAAAEQDRREEIRSISHRLAGIAGLFGFEEIGRAAEAVETALDADASSSELRTLCAKLLEELSSATDPSLDPPAGAGESGA